MAAVIREVEYIHFEIQQSFKRFHRIVRNQRPRVPTSSQPVVFGVDLEIWRSQVVSWALPGFRVWCRCFGGANAVVVPEIELVVLSRKLAVAPREFLHLGLSLIHLHNLSHYLQVLGHLHLAALTSK